MMPLLWPVVGRQERSESQKTDETKKRLLCKSFGFVVGSEVTVISAIGGNVIVNIKDSRVALNQDMDSSHHGSVSFP